MEILYARDLDGTGSMHVCAKDDPGAVAFVAIDGEEDRALTYAVAQLQDRLADLRRSEPPANWKQIRLAWKAQVAELEKHIAALSRLASK